MARGQVEVTNPLGTVTRGKNGVYRVSYPGRMVLWVIVAPNLSNRLVSNKL